MHSTAPFFAISRLRFGIDGHGITTLVTFMGCPLNCKYCLNDFCHENIHDNSGKLNKGIMLLSPQQLYNQVKIDNIYFQTSGGGICFGGGEPGLYADFIENFKQLCPPQWKITLETCLHYDPRTIQRLANVVDLWIVDIKDMNPDIYQRYTGAKSQNLQNLKVLHMLVPPDKVYVKVPLIPDFNTRDDVDRSMKLIKDKIGFNNTHIYKYIKK